MGNTEKKGTVKAILIMIFSMIMSRGIGFVRTAVLAGQAGTGSEADAYAFSFFLPDLLNQILAGGALSVTFIPIFQSLEKDEKAQNRFFSNIFWIGTLIFSIGVALSFFFTPAILSPAAGENVAANAETFALAVKLTRIILPAQLFFFWGALLNGVQYSHRKFFLPSLTPVIYNVGIILGGIALTPYIGIEGFAWGVLVGAFIGNVVVQYFGARKTGLILSTSINHRDPLLKEWFIKTIPLIFTLGLAYSNDLMARIFGSRSPEGTGAIAALNYAYRLFMIFVGLFGQAFAAGIYPFLAKIANEQKYGEMEKTLFSTLEKTAVFTLLGSALLLAVRYDLVALLFQRGQFSPESTELTANALAAYLPGMFFFSAVLLLNRLFFALRKTGTTLVISLVTLAVTIPLYSTIGLSLGVRGIGLMASLAAIISFTMLLIQWKRFYNEAAIAPFLLRIAHIAAVAVITALFAVWIGKLPLPDDENTLWRIIRIMVMTIPPIAIALIYFDKQKILPLKALLKRRKA